ncbi:MAG TPA: response regulator [Longimicrobiales bacterium]|nr:response regulator [Longimicrobiales bacterium]
MPSISQSGPNPRRLTILIAEDHFDSREALSTLLEAFGYDVVTAVNGREAVQLAREAPPDLILMDIMMPEMDGFEATRRVRESEATREIPIIVVTAMEGARNLALQAGATDFLRKPIDSRTLLDRIRALTTA